MQQKTFPLNNSPEGVNVSFRLRLGALLFLFLVSLVGCDSNNNEFVNTTLLDQGFTLQVAADPANLRGFSARFSPSINQFRISTSEAYW